MKTLTKFLCGGILAVAVAAIVPTALAEQDESRGQKGKGKFKQEEAKRPERGAENKREQSRAEDRKSVV